MSLVQLALCLSVLLHGHGIRAATPTRPVASAAATNTPYDHTVPTATVIVTSSAVTYPTAFTFPPVGSIPKDFTPEGLEELWDLVGPVNPPPFTTTREPVLPIAMVSPPPPLYPAWYAPGPVDIFPNLSLPNGFKFGVATSAYQVEGAVKNEGKGPTVWDWASRQPYVIADNTTADIGDLQYYLYKEDVARAAALGINAHSFSVSWARIYPFGVAGSPLNQQGLDHYSDLIDYHLSFGIEPVVTLFHWDTPLALNAYYGGFTSPRIVDDYINYAVTVFKAFNGRVKTWYTFNEPTVQCEAVGVYPFNVSLAPGVNSSTAPYQCSYYLLKAHAGAVKAFRELGISGEIAYKNNDFIGTPWRSDYHQDELAVERHVAFGIGHYADPIYSTGDWPQIMKDTLPPDYLPRFTEDESKELLGSADFFAIDAYSSQLIAAPPEGIDACVSNSSDPSWPSCNILMNYQWKSGWSVGPSGDPASAAWMQATPLYLRSYWKGIQSRWPTNKIYISEFGMDEPFESFRTEMYQFTEDSATTNYYMTYLGEALLAIHEDGIPLQGTFSWSLIDNAEWNSGFEPRFGIQHVNYSTLERTYKRAAYALSEFFAAHLVSNSTE